jgi:hypothetical protein
MWETRLGDIIDDYCVKCKRVMNHAVVSMLNNEPAKVRCRTCHSDHDYRHELPPPPKVDTRKQALFNEVLATVAPGATGLPIAEDASIDEPPEGEPPLEDPPDEDLPEKEPPDDLPPEEEPPPEEPKVPVTGKKVPALKKPKIAAKAPAKAKAKAKGQK